MGTGAGTGRRRQPWQPVTRRGWSLPKSCRTTPHHTVKDLPGAKKETQFDGLVPKQQITIAYP